MRKYVHGVVLATGHTTNALTMDHPMAASEIGTSPLTI